MAFAKVQTVNYDSGASSTTHNITVSSTVQGNLVIVNFGQGDANATVTSVTDDQGNTYAEAASLGGGGGALTNQYYGVQVTGGVTTVTIELSASTGCNAIVDEFSGGASTNVTVFDKASTGSGSSATSSSVTSFTPTADGSLISAFINTDTSVSSFTAGANYTLSQAAGGSKNAQYRLSSSGAETAPASWTTSSVWREVAGAYIVAPAEAGGDENAYFL